MTAIGADTLHNLRLMQHCVRCSPIGGRGMCLRLSGCLSILDLCAKSGIEPIIARERSIGRWAYSSGGHHEPATLALLASLAPGPADFCVRDFGVQPETGTTV